MYLSRITLKLDQLKPEMLQKWQSATPYAAHQWLWQLFPEQQQRPFLFRAEPRGRFFVLSGVQPLTQHPLFTVESKPFRPVLEKGIRLDFQLRSNPVICRNGKRNDVMMNARFQAKQQGIAPAEWWDIQVKAACDWLIRQGENHGFILDPSGIDEFDAWVGNDDADDQEEQVLALQNQVVVSAYQQHQFKRRLQEKPLRYSSVDFNGTLRVTDVALFERALLMGIGKSKALGCGMLMIKRR